MLAASIVLHPDEQEMLIATCDPQPEKSVSEVHLWPITQGKAAAGMGTDDAAVVLSEHERVPEDVPQEAQCHDAAEYLRDEGERVL